MSDDFSCYHIPTEYYPDWRHIEPTFYWTDPVPAELVKPVKEEKESQKTKSTSAYALFFRERQIIEKRYAPYATFGQLSQQIAKQWEMLTPAEKRNYKTRCEKDRKKNIARAVEEKARKLLSSSGPLLQNSNRQNK